MGQGVTDSAFDTDESLAILKTIAGFCSGRWETKRRLMPSERFKFVTIALKSFSFSISHLLNFSVGDFRAYAPEQRSPPFLVARALLLLRTWIDFLRHLALPWLSLSSANLNAGVLQWCRSKCHVLLAWQQKLKNLCVIKTLQCIQNQQNVHKQSTLRLTWTDSPLIWVIKSPGRNPAS